MIVLNHELGTLGEWSDPCNCHSPLEKDNSVEFFEAGGGGAKEKKWYCGHQNRNKKEKVSLCADHGKLSKKTSAVSVSSANGKDHEEAATAAAREKKERDDATAVSVGETVDISFAYTYTRKGGNLCCPSLWVGTSQGHVAVITLSIPVPSGDERKVQPVLALCTGTLVEASYSIIKTSHLDKCGNILPSPFSYWKCADSANNNGGGGGNGRSVLTNSTETSERRFVCLATEKQILVHQLPSMSLFASVEPVPEDTFVVRADDMVIDSGNAIGCLTTDGTVKIYSLPTLLLLLDVECQFSLADYRLIRTFALGRGGEAVFLASPSEIQRLVFTKDKEQMFLSDHGCLFAVLEVPEAKPKGFFGNLFATVPSPLDREELFGPKSGSARKVADYVPGSGLGAFRQSADTAAGAISKAKMALIERGEKLSELEDRAASMNMKAANFASAARALSDKYQKKKWYQL